MTPSKLLKRISHVNHTYALAKSQTYVTSSALMVSLWKIELHFCSFHLHLWHGLICSEYSALGWHPQLLPHPVCVDLSAYNHYHPTAVSSGHSPFDLLLWLSSGALLICCTTRVPVQPVLVKSSFSFCTLSITKSPFFSKDSSQDP